MVVGCVLGLLVGAAVAAALVFGLNVRVFEGSLGALLAFGAAAVTGVLTGLVAGKPIWAHGASIEAGLKAFFGAMLAAFGMFALRKWAAGVHLDLTAMRVGGAGSLGELPMASLPLIGMALGALFEVDNTGDAAPARSAGREGQRPGVRVAPAKAAKLSGKAAPSDSDSSADEAQAQRKNLKG